jgi:hypothetical protein
MGGPQRSSDIMTPFREHLDHCRALGVLAQLVECADYIQNIELLVMEFRESYHLVERLWQPDTELAGDFNGEEGEESASAAAGELILEPFYESLELEVVGSGEEPSEKLLCLSGAVSPVPAGQHPALSRRGLDFVGLRDGDPGHIVLGVAQASKDETVFLLLLRALNALAELSPPLRVVQLGREIVRGRIPEDVRFSLQLGVFESGDDPQATALAQLTRDLAEAFAVEVGRVPQLSGTLGSIDCGDIGPEALDARTLPRQWRV